MRHRAVARPSRGRVAVCVAVVLALTGGCAQPPPEPGTCGAIRGAQHPNVLVVTVCSLRLDHTSVGGYSRPTTPWLAALARDGFVFDTMVAASSWTKPTAASLLTGYTPIVHGLVDFYRLPLVRAGRIPRSRALPPEYVTLPECLAEGGYDTFGRINNVHAGEAFGLTQGLQDVEVEHGMGTAAMLDDLEGWLHDRDGEGPFFAWLFTRDVHTPYSPPEDAFARFARHPLRGTFASTRETIGREVRALVEARADVPAALREQWTDLYDAALFALDRTLSRIPTVLARTGHADDTLVVLTADHGERFFERGRIGHGGRLDEAVLRVPLIVHGPGIAAGRRSSRVVRSIDVYPTVAALAGIASGLPLQGVRLDRVLRGRALEPPVADAYATQGTNQMLRRGPYKLNVGPAGAVLHHLLRDPAETTDVSTAHPEVLTELQRALAEWIESSLRLAERYGNTVERPLSPMVIEQLRALGYLP